MNLYKIRWKKTVWYVFADTMEAAIQLWANTVAESQDEIPQLMEPDKITRLASSSRIIAEESNNAP